METSKIPIADLTKLKYVKHDLTLQCFTWDNYFPTLTELYPHLLDLVYFTTHRKGFTSWSKEFFEKEIYELPENLCYWMESETEITGIKWIVNVDVDYFFMEYPYKVEYDDDEISHYQFLPDIYVRNIAEEIKKAEECIEVLTIALSPECCGGWDNAIRVGKIFTKQLGLRFPKI